MNNHQRHCGVVVPMVTPVTASGSLDKEAVDRLVDFLVAGGVDGIFVLGTTGEGSSVPPQFRRQLVERTVARVSYRANVYAGMGELQDWDLPAGNDYFHAGANAVVAKPPVDFPADRLLPWFETLLDGLEGPLILYNMPATTHVSIPLETVGALVGHPHLVGIKDSENNAERLEELLHRFGSRPEFSIFVGVGCLMARGLKLGAEGIVPSVGNLVPEVCRRLCDAAARGNWVEVEQHTQRMQSVSAVYQDGRTLNQSLSALKYALHFRNLCGSHVLPPLAPLSDAEQGRIRDSMLRLDLLPCRDNSAPVSRFLSSRSSLEPLPPPEGSALL